jgi:hypothetical protein
MTFERAREIIRAVMQGDDVPTADILRALCVLVEKLDRG